jgi:hypothetical protein
MAKSPLTKGLVAGKSSGLLGAGMTTNPAIDNSNSAKVAKALLANHAQKGTKALPPRTGAAQMAKGVNGPKLSGATSIRGGRF